MDGVCPVCHQPECPDSNGGTRPNPGSIPTHLQPGQREYRGYCDWAVHPDEARFLLHRGYAIVDGQREHVAFIHNEAHVTQIVVDHSDQLYDLEQKFIDAQITQTEVAA